MRLTIIGFFLLMITSCRENRHDNNSFESIDISICTPRGNYYCLKVFPSGKAFILYDQDAENKKFFFSNLSMDKIDSISSFVEKILTERLDTAYGLNKEGNYIGEFFSYNLVIKTKDRKFRTFVMDGFSNTNEIVRLNNLFNYLFKIAHDYRISSDSLFVFESRSSCLFLRKPPPPRIYEDTIHYLNPVIVDSIK